MIAARQGMIISAIGLIVAVAFLLVPDPSTVSTYPLLLSTGDEAPTILPTASTDRSKPGFHGNPHHPTPAPTLSSLPRQKEWRKARGYSLVAYDSYDRDTLREMAAAGDPIAQYQLGKRQMSVDPAESLALNYQATVRGFTSSIASTAIVHRLIAEGRLTATSAPRWRYGSIPEDGSLDTNPTDNLIMAYGWGLVAQMRGDPIGINLNRDLEENLARLNDGQLNSACAFAGHTYAALERERAAMGFRSFDNTPPSTTIVDMGRSGEMCRQWSVKRPSCKEMRTILGDTAILMYECTT